MLKETQEPTKRAPNNQSWNNLSKGKKKIVLDYNLKDKINIHETIHTYIND